MDFLILQESRLEFEASEEFQERLKNMCILKPATREEMLTVSGVGEYKYEKYWERFLEVALYSGGQWDMCQRCQTAFFAYQIPRKAMLELKKV